MPARRRRSSEVRKARKVALREPESDEDIVKSCDCCLLPLGSDDGVKQGFARIETCSHRFHFGCIKKWSELETTCPQCKAVFTRIEKLCPETGNIIETVQCEHLFLWDHSDNETDGATSDQESGSQTASTVDTSQGNTVQLLLPNSLEKKGEPKKRKKPVKVAEAAEYAERHLKRMALNDVCYAPPAVTYEAKPLSFKVRHNTEFKLKPVYEEDFISK